jgi:hypothetical protein
MALEPDDHVEHQADRYLFPDAIVPQNDLDVAGELGKGMSAFKDGLQGEKVKEEPAGDNKTVEPK